MNQRDAAIRVLKQHSGKVGVVYEAELDAESLYTVMRDDRVVGAAVADHTGPAVTMVHQLAVVDEYRRDGVATELMRRIAADTPHDTLEAKVRKGLDANTFMASTGWEQVRETNDGLMNVWQRSTIQ